MPDQQLIIEDMRPQNRKTSKSKQQIKALAEDIHENGLKHPVVVDSATGAVVDGLARIEAYKVIGHARIPAIISDDFADMVAALQAARVDAYPEDGVPPASRLVELVGDTRAPKEHYLFRIRRRPMTLRMSDKPKLSIGEMMETALGIHTAQVEIIWNVKARADGGDQDAIVLLQEYREQKIGVYSMRNLKMIAAKAKESSDMPVAERASILTNGLKQLIAISEQMERVGAISTLPEDKRRDLFRALTRHRRQLAAIAQSVDYNEKAGRNKK